MCVREEKIVCRWGLLTFLVDCDLFVKVVGCHERDYARCDDKLFHTGGEGSIEGARGPRDGGLELGGGGSVRVNDEVRTMKDYEHRGRLAVQRCGRAETRHG